MRSKAVVDANLEIRRASSLDCSAHPDLEESALQRMMAGFEELTSGELMIDGQSMAHAPPYGRPVNMVFQNYAIYLILNVFQLLFGLRKERLGKQEVKRRVEGALEMIRLQGYGERRISEMSGGQRQRVALRARDREEAEGNFSRMVARARSIRDCARICRSSCAICSERSALPFVLVTT